MLLSASRLSGVSLLLAAVFLPASQSEAQYVGVGVGYGFGGVRVSAPGVGVSVGRYGGVRVAAPYTSVRVPGRYYYGPRGVVRGSYYATTPGYHVRTPGYVVSGGRVVTGGHVVSGGATASATVVTSATEPTLAAPTPATTVQAIFASEAELAAMSSVDLVNTLTATSASFDVRMANFTGGEGWQTYLALGDASTGDFHACQNLLRRFDSVARDAKFTMIANLEEFTALRLTLRLLVERGGVIIDTESAPAVPSQLPGESLPAPQADALNADVSVSVGGGEVDVEVEHSVLKQ